MNFLLKKTPMNRNTHWEFWTFLMAAMYIYIGRFILNTFIHDDFTKLSYKKLLS